MEPGHQITATLRLVRPLGQGAMGSVWVADHLALNTQVAVKFVSSTLAHNDSVAERFKREAMAAARIKSPYVAQVFDHGVTADGTPYIVMELLEGEDLGARIRRVGPLDPREVLLILRQVGKALTRAHELGIIHRDIKPDNIFITDAHGDLLAKVLDFGIAKHTAEGNVAMTSTGAVAGTPLFMSPEQLLSTKNVDHRTDIWSLGAVVYRALTGKYPFEGETIGALSVVIHAGVFTPPSALRPGLPTSVDEWMRKALSRQAAARFSSANEMAEALIQALNRESSSFGAVDARRASLPSYHPSLDSSEKTVPLDAAVKGSNPSTPVSVPQTLSGASNTRNHAPSRRSPALITVLSIVGVLALGGGLLLGNCMRGTAGPPAAAASATADLLPASAAPTFGTGSDAQLAPAIPSSAATIKPSSVSTAISLPEPTAKANSAATSGAAPPPGAPSPSGSSTPPPKVRDKSTTKPRAPNPKDQDTIGF